MIYAEAAYFDNAPVQHIAAYWEHRRQERLRRERARLARVRRIADAEWDAIPDYKFPLQQAQEHFASLSPERQAQLHAEWK